MFQIASTNRIEQWRSIIDFFWPMSIYSVTNLTFLKETK